MLLILSIEQDHATSNVIDWLIYNKTTFDRINYESLLGAEININNNGTEIILDNLKNYNLRNYNSYWYRRGNFSIPMKLIIETEKSECTETINKFNTDERKTVQDFIHNYLKNITNSINSYTDNSLNKLTVLDIAKGIGLSIPNTLITTKKTDVEKFIKQHKTLISKAIFNGFSFSIDNTSFYLHTLLVEEEDIKEFPEKFYLTQFQSCVEKAFELRIFYLRGKFYSTAIFSQNDEQTKVDFRNYNDDKPNRVIPFNIPKKLKIKLNKLMRKLKLDSGSIDIIVTNKGEYVFLEVNPVGQFTQVSSPCNYYLEKEIAEIISI